MVAFEVAAYGYIMETGRDRHRRSDRARCSRDPDVQRFYLGYGEATAEAASFRDVKHYKRRKRWLS